MQSAFRANSREVLGGESTRRGREVHRDDWVLGVANEDPFLLGNIFLEENETGKCEVCQLQLNGVHRLQLAFFLSVAPSCSRCTAIGVDARAPFILA